jgi:hypothetical protein
MKTMTFQKRRHQRGAAMAEGVVIIGVMAVMWGVMATAYAAGRAKLDAQTTARVDVMYYATNECKSAYRPQSAERSIADEAGGSFDDGAGNGTAAGELQQQAPVGGSSASARSSFFIASSHATVTTTFLNRTRTAQSNSWAVCNEGAYDGDVFGLLAYAKDFFLDLLPGPVKGAL